MGRLASAVVRASHYFLGRDLMMRMMLFADDGKAAVPVQTFRHSIPALFCFMVSLGADIKWQKIRGGTEFQWVGSWVCTRSAHMWHHRKPQTMGREMAAGFDQPRGHHSGL